MKKYLYPALLVLFILPTFLSAQPGNIAKRSDLDLRLWPFYHGVASGDPLSDRVIIWTRLTPNFTSGPVSVDWAMATDTGMTNIVRSGTVVTDSSRDYTVKVDVDSLTPNSWYYYRFTQNNRKSLTGRTRTAPVGDVDSLRFGVVSCSDYVDGYFHGYARLAERNDLDGIIHLGDYIYENGSEGSIGRPHDPPERITELNDYRQRYSQYRLDEDLRCIHQMYPFINVWDDHETANNSWMGGAEAHDTPDDGVWEHRKRMAVQAFDEWIPMRRPDPQDTLRIYRTLQWGDLMDIIMIDTRIIGRDSQVTGNAIDDPARSMLGATQLGWVSSEMQNSNATWKIIGQQVMMAPLEIPFVGPFANDSWDGYRAERSRFYDSVLVNNVENVVVLTGDIHTAWANDLVSDSGAVGVEFIVSSITTLNSPFPVPAAIIQSVNPHIKYVNLDNHGYYILDLNKTRTQADYYFVGDIEDENDTGQTVDANWYVNEGERFLREGSTNSVPRSGFPVLMPSKDPPNPVQIDEELPQPKVAIIGTYPNPFWDHFLVKTYLFKPELISMDLYDLNGNKVKEVPEQQVEAGLYYLSMDGADLQRGVYILKLTAGGQEFVRKVVRF